jgi:hypothetical protein
VIIDPRGLNARDWCDRTADELSDIVSVMKIDIDADWRRWAEYMVGRRPIAGFDPPRPDQFSDWREWAFRFNQSISSMRTPI